MYSFNFTFNTKLMDLVTKLESFIEKQENRWWSRSIAMFVGIIHVLSFQSESQWCCDSDWIFSFFFLYMCCHFSQNHNDVVILTGFFLFLQVEAAKQKKQHENNQIYFIDRIFLETLFYYLLIDRTYIFLIQFFFLFHKTQSLYNHYS